MQPTICAVMVTGIPGREYLAKLAIRAFTEQDHPHKHLLVINDGDPLPLDTVADCTELRPTPGMSLGQLRNYALDHLPSGVKYVVQWDDDDYSHPSRMRRQLQYQGETAASVLRYVTHCNLQTGNMRVCVPTRRPNHGFPGTVMHRADTTFRYPEIGKGEDTEFIRKWVRTSQLVIINNNTSPTLYVRSFHGKNTWSERHVMGFPSGNVALNHENRHYVSRLRQAYLGR